MEQPTQNQQKEVSSFLFRNIMSFFMKTINEIPLKWPDGNCLMCDKHQCFGIKDSTVPGFISDRSPRSRGLSDFQQNWHFFVKSAIISRRME